MNILSAENLSKSFNDRWLFRNLTLGVSQGEKIGLVGVNGAGKSTLLSILGGDERSDTGTVGLRQGTSVGFLRQEPTFAQHLTVREAIFDHSSPVFEAVQQYERALETGEKMEEAISRMDVLDGWSLETRIRQIMGKLGIHDLNATIQTLSGGQRKRIALAQVLLREPDLLILDEPTNHLDLEVIEWLEEYLSAQKLTLLLVSHDRYFLDRVTDVIWELDQEQIFRYDGNYSYFLEKRAERIQQQADETEKARKLFSKELEWLRRQPKARTTKAKYRIDAAEDLRQKAQQRHEQATLDLQVKPQRQGKKILELHELSKAFDQKKIIDNFSYTFRRGEKIGIVGENGVGKSTFLNLIMGRLNADSGQIEQGERTVFGYYEQNAIQVPPDQRVIDVVKGIAEFIELGEGQSVSATQLLSRFLFSPAKQYDYVYKLSGGERRRLQLLLTLVHNPNFLILDEPTNDLDIFTLTVLEEFLSAFGGCLLVVSHDRYFMDKIVEHIFAFEGNGVIRDINGNYTRYRDLKAIEEGAKAAAETARQIAKTIHPAAPVPTTDKRKLSFKEKQEFEQLEREIPKLEAEKAQLIEQMGSGGTHQDLSKWAERIGVLTADIDRKTERWLELSEWM